ncbi:HpcH/HpaI aldolase/citrate lyase family protein [Sulfurimonas sp. HSL-3221]|uniref:HpcH/HpaI aldolase/citrate lyase family protein n=1 Tax=Sulfurimonadaceae TaxID=2771471 RepID=UPI001E31358B|nr:HpcH/HpaI aldolase/citrate lyase family protein [Sulfurimonas sp. HSL-3221]UFS61476.1 HpcH/HpaI aldolase/citrate lyase family protein [Sulfurimonas sp. HSL-3221]
MRSEPIHPAELGATLFVPATHPGLAAVLGGKKYPQLRSCVIDLEDGIDADERDAALQHLRTLLPRFADTPLLRFLRPSSPEMLSELLRMTGIEKLDGFVLPKFGGDNADAWLALLDDNAFAIMPSIEGSDLFSQTKLHTLAERLQPYRERIPTLRFGLEDMLRQLGMVRDCDTPLYGLVAPAQIIATLLTVFKPRGFSLCGGVYKCFKDKEGFAKELEEDLKQGLFGKTIIHPSQIAAVEHACRVDAADLAQAEAIVSASCNVSNFRGMMVEKPTQLPWARMILRRAALYGVKA